MGSSAAWNEGVVRELAVWGLTRKTSEALHAVNERLAQEAIVDISGRKVPWSFGRSQLTAPEQESEQVSSMTY